MMAIEMAGGVYCPLSPRDPPYRLHLLLEETHSRLILGQQLTRRNFFRTTGWFDVDSVLADFKGGNDIHSVQLSVVNVELKNIAYVIFTSGSTGVPKAVSIMEDEVY